LRLSSAPESTGPTLAGELLWLYDTVHEKDFWIQPLAQLLRRVSAEEAAWQPAPGVASIWEITLHVGSWSDYTRRWLDGEPRGDVVDWPLPASQDRAAWKRTRDQVLEAVRAVRRQMESLSPEQVLEMPKRKRTVRMRALSNLLAHNAYHAGQIAKLRALYRCAREAPGESA